MTTREICCSINEIHLDHNVQNDLDIYRNNQENQLISQTKFHLPIRIQRHIHWIIIIRMIIRKFITRKIWWGKIHFIWPNFVFIVEKNNEYRMKLTDNVLMDIHMDNDHENLNLQLNRTNKNKNEDKER